MKTKKEIPMKTVAKFTLASFAAALLVTGSAFANDFEVRSFDNHHGVVTYFYRPAQKEATVAFYSHGKGIGRVDGKAQRQELSLKRIETAHGAISYYAPVK
jgi:hypothetical protein